MAHRLKRAWISRTAVAAAVVASSFVVVGVAQAAIAGAPPETTTSRPALTSATILSTSLNTVELCFSQPVTSTTYTGKVQLGGYRSGNILVASAVGPESASPNCIQAAFPSTSASVTAPDLTQYTVATVLANANNPLGDSATLNGSTTHNGTSSAAGGLTIAPDLSGVVVNTAGNSIQYTEDQAIGAFGAGNFTFTDVNGNVCTAARNAVANGNVVTVSFNGDTCTGGLIPVGSETVSSAVQAGQTQNAVTAANDITAGNTADTVAVPNAANGGKTTRPDLTSATLQPGLGAIDFTFDSNVTLTTLGLTGGNFFADLSTGDAVQGTSATLLAVSLPGTATVRVVFPNLTAYDEYVVKGSVTAGAVLGVGITNGVNLGLNVPGSAPAGDNAGAFARGFTTGPDAYAAVFNRTSGVASVSLDQRARTSIPGNISLLGANGDLLATATSANVNPVPVSAGPETIQVTFPTTVSALGANIAIENSSTTSPTPAGAAFASGFNTSQGNVDQILAPTTTSAVLKASQAAARAKPLSRKVIARREARLHRASGARLAKLRSAYLRAHKAHKSHKSHKSHKKHHRA